MTLLFWKRSQPKSCSENSTFSHPALGEVDIVVSARATRTTLSVRPSGEIRLTFPKGADRNRALQFLEQKQEWILQARARIAQRTRIDPELSTADIEQLRRAAKATLPQRLDELAQQHGLRYQRVTIRAARTKWGCCTGQNNISLSLYLMTLPQELRDYVLLHELCHTVHHDHSPRFHALLDSCLNGKEKEFSRRLRKYSIK